MQVALVDLVLYALLFFAIAFAFAARKMTQALFGPVISALQAIPAIGNALASPFKAVENAIVNACYSIEKGADALVGGAWHRTVELLKLSWSEFKRHAIIGLKTSFYIPLLISAYHHLKSLVNHVAHTGAGISHAVKTLEREYHGIEHRVKDLERKIAHGIGHDLRIHIKALEKWEKGAQAAITQTIPNAIAGVAGDLSDLKRFLGIKNLTTYAEWAGAVVLAAIGLDALSALRCDEFGRNFRNRGCSQWGALDDLLGLLALGILAAEFDTLVHTAQDLTGGAVTVFDDVFGLSR